MTAEHKNGLIGKLHATEVVCGEWVTPYHRDPNWEPIAGLPRELEGVVEFVLAPINPIYQSTPEAFYVSAQNNPLTFIHIIARVQGSPPMTTPLIGRPILDIPRLFYPIYQGRLQEVKDRQFGYRNSFRLNFQHVQPVVPSQEGFAAETLPQFNNIIISPFRYFSKNKPYQVVAEDPWRFELDAIGIPREILLWAREVKKSVHSALETKKGEIIEFELPSLPFNSSNSKVSK